MADNLVLNSGSGGGTIRTLEDGSSIQWPVGVVAYATTVGSPDVLQVVIPTAGLPVQQQTGATFTVVGSGTFAVQVDGAALTALQLIDDSVATTGAAITAKGVAAVGTDGTNARILKTDASGELQVDVLTMPSVAVTNAGTFAVQVDGSALTSLQLLDDVVFTRGAVVANTNKGIQVWATRNDAGAGFVDVEDSDASPISVDSGGRVGICDLGGSITVDGTVSLAAGTATNEVVGDAAHDAAAAGNPLLMGAYASAAAPTDVSADADAVRLWALRSGALATQPTYGGILAVAGNGASGTGVQRVTIANDSTGILAGVTTVTTVTTCSTVTTLTGSGIAHDAADSGNPHKIGAKATTSMAGLTLVANADRTDLFAGVDGALIVRPECSLEDVVQERATNTDGASTAFASGLAAPGAGIRLWVKSVTICNSSASFCTVDLRDGAAGAVLWTLPVPATGGVTHVFEPPLKLTANTALAFDASAATTTLTISANAFKSKV